MKLFKRAAKDNDQPLSSLVEQPQGRIDNDIQALLPGALAVLAGLLLAGLLLGFSLGGSGLQQQRQLIAAWGGSQAGALQQAQAQGQGVILMAVHFTTLEIGAALLGQVHTIDGMYREHGNPVFDFVQRRGRERHNLDATAIEREDVRAMIKVLRAGRAIWYAPDQDYGRRQSIFVPLFGIPAATVTATTKFARLGRARVIPFTQERLADGSGYRLVIHLPLENFPGESEEADCLRINQWIEQAVAQCPEQYLWSPRAPAPGRLGRRPPAAQACRCRRRPR